MAFILSQGAWFDAYEKYANDTIEPAKEIVPEGVDKIKGAMTDFASKASLPIKIG